MSLGIHFEYLDISESGEGTLNPKLGLCPNFLVSKKKKKKRKPKMKNKIVKTESLKVKSKHTHLHNTEQQ